MPQRSILQEILEKMFSALADCSEFSEDTIGELKKITEAGNLNKPADIKSALDADSEKYEDS